MKQITITSLFLLSTIAAGGDDLPSYDQATQGNSTRTITVTQPRAEQNNCCSACCQGTSTLLEQSRKWSSS
jgi:hypothetical protein